MEEMVRAKRYSQQFKDDAVQYRKNHPELTLQDTASHLGVRHIRTQALAVISKSKCRIRCFARFWQLFQ